MTDLDDLIARLRARKILHVESDGYQWREPVNPDGDEAAAALEALRAENERLRGVYYELGVRDAADVVGGREALRQEWQEQLMRRILALLDAPALTPR